MIGDELLSDILFGNDNGMTTVWVTRYRNEWSKLSEKNLKLYDLEKEH